MARRLRLASARISKRCEPNVISSVANTNQPRSSKRPQRASDKQAPCARLPSRRGQSLSRRQATSAALWSSNYDTLVPVELSIRWLRWLRLPALACVSDVLTSSAVPKDTVVEYLDRFVEAITSKAARRALVNSILFFVASVALFSIAAIGYILFYRSYLPDQITTVPVHIQYG